MYNASQADPEYMPFLSIFCAIALWGYFFFFWSKVDPMYWILFRLLTPDVSFWYASNTHCSTCTSILYIHALYVVHMHRYIGRAPPHTPHVLCLLYVVDLCAVCVCVCATEIVVWLPHLALNTKDTHTDGFCMDNIQQRMMPTPFSLFRVPSQNRFTQSRSRHQHQASRWIKLCDGDAQQCPIDVCVWVCVCTAYCSGLNMCLYVSAWRWRSLALHRDEYWITYIERSSNWIIHGVLNHAAKWSTFAGQSLGHGSKVFRTEFHIFLSSTSFVCYLKWHVYSFPMHPIELHLTYNLQSTPPVQ